jgi:hypothetical protein
VTKQVIDETTSVFAAFRRFLEQNSERPYHDNRIGEVYQDMVAVQPNNLVHILRS